MHPMTACLIIKDYQHLVQEKFRRSVGSGRVEKVAAATLRLAAKIFKKKL